MRRFLPIVALVLAGCRDALAVDGEVAAPGAPARIVLDETAWAGGGGMRHIVTIDSASGMFTRVDSTLTVGGGSSATVVSGRADTLMIRALYRQAATRAFRAAPASYLRPRGIFVPPDPSWGSLTVTANQRTRRIDWEKGGGALPQAVGYAVCLARVAAGGLVTCLPD